MTTKHESATQSGLFFWAEPFRPVERTLGPGGLCKGPLVYVVTAQADGGPAYEAFDDWFANEKDADEIAQKLAKGEL